MLIDHIPFEYFYGIGYVYIYSIEKDIHRYDQWFHMNHLTVLGIVVHRCTSQLLSSTNWIKALTIQL